MLILSFDIGIKNLAYCLIDSDDKCILDWNIIDCSDSNETLKMIKELDSLDYLRNADMILLEKQPSFNPKMRTMSTAIYVYFILRIQHEQKRMVKIMFYPAKYKLKCCDVQIIHKSLNKYRQNKNLGIEHTRFLLKSHKNFFENNKKKDDLADCFLQAYSYILFFMNS